MYRQLYTQVLRDFRDSWGLTILSDDFKFVNSRESSFFEEQLPLMDDVLLDSLSRDFPSQNPYPGFLDEVWDAAVGLHEAPSALHIRAIRQISRLCKKIFEVCPDTYVTEAISGFRETDRSLPTVVPTMHGIDRVCSILHGSFLHKVATRMDHAFGHGPGAVADRTDSVARWDFPSVSDSIAREFDIVDLFPETYYEEWPVPISLLESRLVAVPKTATTPRLISIEPAVNMYLQQGILNSLSKYMNGIDQLNMVDQSINQELARVGSLDGRLSTIDLSEASDRVSLALTDFLFRLSPSFRNLINSVRTPVTRTVDGELIVLNKFASMGCALTFPVQMLVFRSIVIYAICAQEGDLSPKNIRRWGASPDISVFGDDIIVPTHYSQSVFRCLELFGLRVNQGKSFTTGFFRESCGGDYYAGIRVNPVYLRRRPPKTLRDVESIVSWAATSLLMEEALLPRTAKYLSDCVQNIVGPVTNCVGSLSVSHPRGSRTRYNPDLQLREARGVFLRPHRKKANASDRAILCHALSGVNGSFEPLNPADFLVGPIRIGEVKSTFSGRLTHHGRPVRAEVTYRWAPTI